MACVAIADIDLERARTWAVRLGREAAVVENLADMHTAIQRGRLPICINGNLLSQCGMIDVLVDSTSAISAGLQFAQTAISHHKHVVMMNSEADLIFGPLLMAQARREGVVYTSADGDQHTVLKRLINEIELWGFKTVMAGNMKGFLDRYSNPTVIIPEADKRSLDYKMCASYTDGTKLCIEMALIANAIGARTSVPGMYGPRINDIYDAIKVFDFNAMWDGSTPLVDYVLGASPPGGVFVIGFNDHPHQAETLSAYLPCRLGPGPFYIFHRPYHLGHIEVVPSIAEASLDGWAVLQPGSGMLTNVYAYAKKDLHQGDILDGIGGYNAYGLIENSADNALEPGLPICLAEDVVLHRDVSKDGKIFLSDITHDPSDPRFEAFRLASKV
jgi:predicted homoserine dehydrogenase-like protein